MGGSITGYSGIHAGSKVYDQLVIVVPEKFGKKIAKAIKKKFDIHCIEGNPVAVAGGTDVQILSNGVNSTLLTIVQVWAEGWLEGAS